MTRGQIQQGCLEIEQDAIYYLTQTMSGNRIERELVKLSEMEDNVKIHKLMKCNQYAEALTIAKDANFPREIQCEIIKENADKLFSQKKYDEAIVQYMQTIGFLNPSYVIQNFIEVTRIENLIKYLEKLIRENNKNQISTYNKDYTALLLNCYVKKDKQQKI